MMDLPYGTWPEKDLNDFVKRAEQHAKCKTTNTAKQPQHKAGSRAEGRCHMPGTQCAHITEYSCMQCGFGWAEEAKS